VSRQCLFYDFENDNNGFRLVFQLSTKFNISFCNVNITRQLNLFCVLFFGLNFWDHVQELALLLSLLSHKKKKQLNTKGLGFVSQERRVSSRLLQN